MEVNNAIFYFLQHKQPFYPIKQAKTHLNICKAMQDINYLIQPEASEDIKKIALSVSEQCKKDGVLK